MPLIGTFTPMGDKSISHRVALFALLAGGQCLVSNLSQCDDVLTSLAVCRALGCRISQQGNALAITGMNGKLAVDGLTLDCANSGTTMRLMCGILSGLQGSFVLDGDEMLRKRPMARVVKPLRAMGADISCVDDKPPIRINGHKALRAINYVAPMASAQVKSALLLAGLKASGRTLFTEPAPSRNHSEIMLQQFGARLERQGNSISLLPGVLTMPSTLSVPGDASSAAFFLCAAAFIPHSRVSALNVSLNPTRIEFLHVLKAMGAGVEISRVDDRHELSGHVLVYHKGPLNGVEVKAEAIAGLIDEIPILALVAANAHGPTVFHGVGELAVKEVNRLLAIKQQLGQLGATIEIAGDDLIISGQGLLCGRADVLLLDSQNDHRMAMTLALALKALRQPGEIKGANSVSVSYPGFYDDLKRLWQQ